MGGPRKRYSGGTGAPAPTSSGGRGRATAWLGGCVLLGAPYPWVALLNPPWTYLLLGAPLLALGWITRPLNPAVRLAGFLAFVAGAAVSSLLS